MGKARRWCRRGLVVPGLSRWWPGCLGLSVRAGDGGGDQGDVGAVEAAQDAGEVDGDVVVAEAGGDAQDGGFGGRAAELAGVQGGDGGLPVDVGVGGLVGARRVGAAGRAGVQGGDGVLPVDVGVGVLVGAGAGVDAAGGEAGPGQPGVVGADQLGGGGVAGEAGGVGDQRARQGAGGHWSFTSVMAARTAVVSAMVLWVVQVPSRAAAASRLTARGKPRLAWWIRPAASSLKRVSARPASLV